MAESVCRKKVTQVKYTNALCALSLLTCLGNSPVCCQSRFEILSHSDREVEDEKELKIHPNPESKDQLAQIFSVLSLSISLGQSTLISSDNSV